MMTLAKIKMAAVAGVVTVLLAAVRCEGRDLGGIPWNEFKARSELVFEGLLVKAELVGREGPAGSVRCTYKVWKTFKGPEMKEVTFASSQDEDINKEVGRIAIVALRRDGEKWVLSVDQRSCWKHENRMKTDFGGYPVFEIPEVLLHGFPQELAETVTLKVRYGDEYRDQKARVFPLRKVEDGLKAALGGAEPAQQTDAQGLLDAAKNGDISAVQFLIAKGVSVRTKDENGRTPLHLAAANGHMATVDTILEAGADINARDNAGKTPLDLAEAGGHPQLTAFLLNNGAKRGGSDNRR